MQAHTYMHMFMHERTQAETAAQTYLKPAKGFFFQTDPMPHIYA